MHRDHDGIRGSNFRDYINSNEGGLMMSNIRREECGWRTGRTVSE